MDVKCKKVLDKLLIIHTLKFLEENFNLLFEGNYLTNGSINLWIQNRLIDLCQDLRNEAVVLVDVFAPPDHILNSVLGVQDGKVKTKDFENYLKEFWFCRFMKRLTKSYIRINIRF